MENMNRDFQRRKQNGVVLKSFPGYFLIGALLLSLIFLILLLQPFLISLILAAILATAFHGLYEKILSFLKGHASISAFITCLIVLIFIVIPVAVFLLLLIQQAIDMYGFISAKLQSGELDAYLRWEPGNIFYDLLYQIQGRLDKDIIDINQINLKENLIGFAQNISSFIALQSASIVKIFGEKFIDFIINFFVLFFALYHFLKEGTAITKNLMQISPLPLKYNAELFRKFREMSQAALYGIFLTSIAQGVIGGIGFLIVGIPNAFLWGTAIAFFSLVPVVGTALIWFPASVILFLSGNITGGIVLFLWGLFLVSTMDNFLRAYLIGNKARMNSLLAFLSVFGGIGLFGLIGVILGPLILTIFFTFLHIYELEYRAYLRK